MVQVQDSCCLDNIQTLMLHSIHMLDSHAEDALDLGNIHTQMLHKLAEK